MGVRCGCLSLLLLPLLAATGELTFTQLPGEIVDNTMVTESLAWGDYDGDGFQDLYLTNDGANLLLRNDGGAGFIDKTQMAGVGDDQWSVGAAFGDLDNDGDLDLFVVTFDTGNDVLYRNDGPLMPGGEVVFTDVSATSGITDETSSRGMALVDYNRDGLLDIYVNALGPDLLYRNDGNLTFTNVAPTLGVAAIGQGVGVVASDIDNNGWPDLFTGNRSSDPNQLSLNSSGLFEDITASANIDKVGQGMGVLAFDYDNDLDIDLYWTAWPQFSDNAISNALYQNQGDGRSFVDVAQATGTLDTPGWGISANTADVNLDGYEDMLITNGFSMESSANVLFVNDAGQGFTDESSVLGDLLFDGRGVAFADYDRDGDLDVSITGGFNAPTRIWRNDTPLTSRNWLTLELVGFRSNRSAIGARVTVQTGDLQMVKEVSGGAGRGSQNSLPLEFGLANQSSATINVRWPSGYLQRLNISETNRYLTVFEPLFQSNFETVE